MITEFYISQKKLLKGIGVGAAFMAFGITVCLVARHEGGASGIMIPISMVPVLAGIITIVPNLKRWNDKKPALILDRRGITINTNSLNDGFIPWEDVRIIYTYEIRDEICFDLKETEHYLSKQNFIKRFILKLNHKKYDRVVYISPRILNCTYGELLHSTVESFDRYTYRTPEPS